MNFFIFPFCYGNNIKKGKEHPLKTLSDFLNKNLKEIVNIVHIIGLFLYSSDRGFSIVDYKKINPSLGNLKDLKNIGEKFSLMVDFVCNHISSKSKWFKEFKKGNKLPLERPNLPFQRVETGPLAQPG